MKPFLTLVALVLSLSICAQNSKKDIYIDKHLPLLRENLSEKDLNTFKKSMRFNSKGHLSAQNFELLEQGAKDQIGVYYQYIFSQQSGKSDTIAIVNSNGTELVIAPDGTLLNQSTVSTEKVATSQIVGQQITSYDFKTYQVSELLTQDGLFVVTSTTCGPCVVAYPELNKLTQDPNYTHVNFTALYRDSFEKINTYKNGSMFNRFGALEQPWTIFSSDDLIQRFKSGYDFKGVPYVFIKHQGKIIYKKYGIDLKQIQKHLAKK